MLGVGCSVPFINGNQSISRYAFDVRYDWLVPLIKGTRPLRKTCDSLTLMKGSLAVILIAGVYRECLLIRNRALRLRLQPVNLSSGP